MVDISILSNFDLTSDNKAGPMTPTMKKMKTLQKNNIPRAQPVINLKMLAAESKQLRIRNEELV